MNETTSNADWTPEFSRWRHGGWYVNNIKYPSGAVGCVSNNYGDKKWRIACDPREFDQQPTFRTRVEAAHAERELVTQMTAQPTAPEEQVEAHEAMADFDLSPEPVRGFFNQAGEFIECDPSAATEINPEWISPEIEFDHTPGPWALHCDSKGFWLQSVSEPEAQKGELCDIHGIPDKETEANARLMAASPSMLEVLLEAQAWFALEAKRPIAVLAKECEIGQRLISNISASIISATVPKSCEDIASEDEQSRRKVGGWCQVCGCGNDRMGYAHLPNCGSVSKGDGK